MQHHQKKWAGLGPPVYEVVNSPVITCWRAYRRVQHIVQPNWLQSIHGRMARAVFCIESLIDASAPARISASSSLDSDAALRMLQGMSWAPRPVSVDCRCLCLNDGLEDIQVTTQRRIVKRCCTNLSRSNGYPCLAVCVCVTHVRQRAHSNGTWWGMVAYGSAATIIMDHQNML